VKASASGKIILFGEHAVVYGRPALAVPVPEVCAQVDVSPGARRGIWIDAPDIGLHSAMESLPPDNALSATIHSVLDRLHTDPFPDLQITITSSIPVASGMGSGAAVSVALIRALSGALDGALADDEVNLLAYGAEKLHHGTPSGIDNTVVTYARPVFFVRGHPMQTLSVARPFVLVIAHTGIAASTRESVGDVRKLWEGDLTKFEAIFDQVGVIAGKARLAIEQGTWRDLGPLMNQNHALLQKLTVSSVELDRLVEAALQAGALGAKLSGGGRGGNVIALPDEGRAGDLTAALEAANSPRVIIATVKPTA
jgi:mevalonate kinase